MASDERGKRYVTRIRPRVWIVAGALLAPAAALFVALQLPGETPVPDMPPTRHPAAAPAPAPKTAIAAQVVFEAAPDASTPSVARAGAAAEAAAPRAQIASAHVSASSAAAREHIDSRLASELRILEDEAARQVGAESGRADDDARRAELADAFLVEYFVQDAYRGTDFPIGYPAAQRTREAAVSRVAALDPAQRSAQLEVALQQASELRIEPRFEAGLVWEAASR